MREDGSAREAASHGFRAPSRGERPAGPGGATERGSAPWHRIQGPASPRTIRELGFISPAPGQPRVGSTVPRGVPLLSPPALLRESDNEDKTLEAGFSSGWINLPFSF